MLLALLFALGVIGVGGTVVVGPQNVKMLAVEQLSKNHEFNRYMKVRASERQQETYALEMTRREKSQSERQKKVEADLEKFDHDLQELVLPASINALIREVDSCTDKDDDKRYWTEVGSKAMKLARELAYSVENSDVPATFEQQGQATNLHRAAQTADQKLSKIKRAERLLNARAVVADVRMMSDKNRVLGEWKRSLDSLVGARTQIMYAENSDSLTIDEKSVLTDIEEQKKIVEAAIEVLREEKRRMARELEAQLEAEREVVRQQALAHQAKLVAEAEARRQEAIRTHQEEARRAASQYADRYGRAKRRTVTAADSSDPSVRMAQREARAALRSWDGSIVRETHEDDYSRVDRTPSFSHRSEHYYFEEDE